MSSPVVASPLHPHWHYHFLGIGGVGMSGLAEAMHRLGFRVSGSDIQDSNVLRHLAECGIPVRVGHDADALRDAQAVVYTSAVRPTHPIWSAVERLGLPRYHRAQMLGALSRGQRAVAITGTHGKTTTSACLTWVLRHAGGDPTALIGGYVPQLGGVNVCVGAGSWMVLEADESDGSFVHLAPDAIVITNIEDDHLDHYGTQEKIREAFVAFAGLLPQHGVLVYCRDDPQANLVAAAHGGRTVSYGLHPAATVRVERLPRAPGHGGAGVRAALVCHGARHEVCLRIPGLHNAVNLAGVYAMARALGLPAGTTLEAIQQFTGVARRQQYIGQVGALRIFDDYAHHPTEIRATLAAFRDAFSGPITVVFQPHLYSRTARFARAFAEALRSADRITVTDVYGSREAPQPGVSGRLIVEALAGHAHARFASTWQDAGDELARALPEGILLTMGAGDITHMGPHLLRLMRNV